jgi:hypothetical protein
MHAVFGFLIQPNMIDLYARLDYPNLNRVTLELCEVGGLAVGAWTNILPFLFSCELFVYQQAPASSFRGPCRLALQCVPCTRTRAGVAVHVSEDSARSLNPLPSKMRGRPTRAESTGGIRSHSMCKREARR